MRFVSSLLVIALASSVALAEDAKPANPPASPAVAPAVVKVPFRVVRVLMDTHQALLFDRDRGTHVLASPGDSIDGFTVAAIDSDEVTLTGASGIEVVLEAPTSSWRSRHREAPSSAPAPVAAPAPAPAPVAAAAPVD